MAITQKQQSYSSLGSSLNLSKTIFGGLISLALSGCSGQQLHSDLFNDSTVMVRKWTLQTHGPFETGDHGTEYSNPVMSQNTLIFGNRTVGLIALYPKINQQRWTFQVSGGVVSELTVDENSVYFGGGDGFFYSVSIETGKVNWKYELRNDVVSRPTLSGGRVFVSTSNDMVYALDAGTGKWLWHYRRRSLSGTSVYGASQPLVDGADVIVGMSDGFVVALSTDEGVLKWEKKIHSGTKFTNVNAHPLLEDGFIFIPSYDGALYSLKRSNGDTVWRFDAGGSKNVVMDRQFIFLPSSDGTIYCLQKANGKVVWKFQLDSGVPTQLVMTEKFLIVGSSYQYLYVVDKTTGKGAYRFDAGYNSGFSGTPLYDATQRRVYALSGAGNLYAFQFRTPARKDYPHGAIDPYALK